MYELHILAVSDGGVLIYLLDVYAQGGMALVACLVVWHIPNFHLSLFLCIFQYVFFIAWYRINIAQAIGMISLMPLCKHMFCDMLTASVYGTIMDSKKPHAHLNNYLLIGRQDIRSYDQLYDLHCQFIGRSCA